ncbi:MAG: phosphatidate cytidylyltransferase [Chitinophagaceae bacterium]|nr:phosphatidate cytidylyltransferase [Chitinophagaceae bacterium]MBK9532893.1 phosphatidate cytidylyltransferase [Chitinophagaceae bacterium]
MAFNFQTFKTRALTALLFVVVMLTGLLWNFWSFLILFTVIHFGCWYEFVKLMKKIDGDKYLGYCLFGLIYITMPVLMMIDLRTISKMYTIGYEDKLILDIAIPLCVIFSIWVNDTMAYLVGSFIGRTPLTKISPKKTWEGTIGGIILCVIAIGYLFPLVMGKDLENSNVPSGIWFIIPAICGIFGTAGDILESKLKRMAGVKDSGSFMPGHGGFLDRFDSLLVAVPAVWAYVYFIM